MAEYCGLETGKGPARRRPAAGGVGDRSAARCQWRSPLTRSLMFTARSPTWVHLRRGMKSSSG